MKKAIFCPLIRITPESETGNPFEGQAQVLCLVGTNDPWIGEGDVKHISLGIHRYLPSDKELGFPEITYVFHADGVKTEAFTSINLTRYTNMTALSPTDIDEISTRIHEVITKSEGSALEAILQLDPAVVDYRQKVWDYVTNTNNPGSGPLPKAKLSRSDFNQMMLQAARRISGKDSSTQTTYTQVMDVINNISGDINLSDAEVSGHLAWCQANQLLDAGQVASYTTDRQASLLELAVGTIKFAVLSPADLGPVLLTETGAKRF